jgi:O-antigen ligase
MKNFRAACYAILACLPLYGVRFQIFGQASNLLEVVTLGVLIAYIAKSFSAIKMKDVPRPIALLLLAATISLFVAPDFANAFASYRQYYLEPILFFWMLTREFSGFADVNKLMLAVCVPAIPIALFSIAQYLNLYPIPAGQYRIDHRSTSLYSYANAVGLYLGPIIAACIATVLNMKSRFDRDAKIMLATAGLSVLAILFSRTEGAWLGLAAAGLIAGFSMKQFRHPTLGVLFAGMLVLALFPPISEKLIYQLSLQDFSGAVRRTIWQETSGMLADRWMFGAGLAGYQTDMIPYQTSKAIEIFWFPHNIILNIWVELGLLGLIAFVFIFRAVRRAVKTVNAPTHWIATAPLLVMLVHGLFDVPFFKPDLALLTASFLAFVVILQGDYDASKRSA